MIEVWKSKPVMSVGKNHDTDWSQVSFVLNPAQAFSSHRWSEPKSLAEAEDFFGGCTLAHLFFSYIIPYTYSNDVSYYICVD